MIDLSLTCYDDIGFSQSAKNKEKGLHKADP